MSHWLHGPVAHVIVDEVDNLTPGSLNELQQAALFCGIQVWLVIDAAAGTHVTWAPRPRLHPRRGPRAGPVAGTTGR